MAAYSLSGHRETSSSLRYHLGPLSSVSSRCGTTNNAQAQPLGVASRAAELGGGLWRAAVGKTGRLTVEWGTTVEHTVSGACAEHARLQLTQAEQFVVRKSDTEVHTKVGCGVLLGFDFRNLPDFRFPRSSSFQKRETKVFFFSTFGNESQILKLKYFCIGEKRKLSLFTRF